MKTVFITVFLLLTAIVLRAQECNIKLTGHVEDLDTRQKLSGASVTLYPGGKLVTTDAQGNFAFSNLCPGNYQLKVTHIDCKAFEEDVQILKDRHIDIDMPHAANTLGEVVVSSMRTTARGGFTQALGEKALQQSNGENLATALSRINGVYMLQTGSTIAKPVFHGLHSNRVLTINNGVRQEGQQWGNEHAPEIDPFIAAKLTVVKGVDELRYGSDAIGGVVLVEPKTLTNSTAMQAAINSAYFTNNRQYIVSATMEQALKRIPGFAFRIQGTLKRGANSSTPDYRLNNTGSREDNFSLTAAYRKHQWQTELFYSYFNTQIGIFEGSHIGNLTDLEKVIASDQPSSTFTGENTYQIRRPYQDARHQLLKSKTTLQKANQKFTLLLAAQLNNRKEFDITRSAQNKTPQSDLGIGTYSQELIWERNKVRKHSSLAGINSMQQENQYAGRYLIPAYRSFSVGAYYITKWQGKKWNAEAGARFDHKKLDSYRLREGVKFEENHLQFSTIAASFNAGYKITPVWKVSGNLALAQRAPQVNELLSNGVHHGTATFESGNINLVPEQSFNFFFIQNWQTKDDRLNIELTLYNNNIRHFIYQQPIPDSPMLTIAGAFPLLRFKQNDARLRGIDFSASYRMNKCLTWETKYAMLRARNLDLDDWLIRMPADRIETGLNYAFADGKKIKETYVSASIAHMFKQTRVPDERNGRQDYKAAPAAYSLVEAEAGTSFTALRLPLTVSLSVKNLFNTVYRDYLNSMRYFSDEMGRNLQFRIHIPLGITKIVHS